MIRKKIQAPLDASFFKPNSEEVIADSRTILTRSNFVQFYGENHLKMERLVLRSADPFDLACARFVFYFSVLLCVGMEPYAVYAIALPSFWAPTGLMSWLHLPVLSYGQLTWLESNLENRATFVCSRLVQSGLSAAAATSGVYLLGLCCSFGMVDATLCCLELVLIGMAFAPMGEHYSLDSTLARWKGEPLLSAEPQGRYGWPLKYGMVVCALVFTQSGITKLSRTGLDYALSDQLRRVMIIGPYINDFQFHAPFSKWPPLMAISSWPMAPFGFLTLFFEVFYFSGIDLEARPLRHSSSRGGFPCTRCVVSRNTLRGSDVDLSRLLGSLQKDLRDVWLEAGSRAAISVTRAERSFDPKQEKVKATLLGGRENSGRHLTEANGEINPSAGLRVVDLGDICSVQDKTFDWLETVSMDSAQMTLCDLARSARDSCIGLFVCK